ncbi:Translin family-domain-containing protein [Diaporthe sp. PMI_573]|nr:Translin family-domain-containing protein [Diaporthaceae sp. PMI_573]
MSGQKRDFRGNAKSSAPKVPLVRNEHTPMFESFRDELDEHHDRRERIVKASRDITALSKKIIFSLQRIRTIQPELPDQVERDIQSRLGDISKLLATLAPDVQGINRHRYSRSLMCIEELIEALTFAHYLRTQRLMGFGEAVAKVAELSEHTDDQMMDVDAGDPPATAGADRPRPAVQITENDYLMGIFDLSGEMMRFATTSAALTGKMAGGSATPPADGRERTIVVDMQDLGSFFEMLPQQYNKSYQVKLSTLRSSVLKVEKLAYGLTVRGTERPTGWMPEDGDGPPEDDY